MEALLTFFKIVSFTLCFGTVIGVNYCDIGPCYKTHIACHSNGNYSSNCPSNVRMVKMDRHKGMILRNLNEFRNEFASGMIENFAAATRMAQMKWNDELEYFASLNVRSCVSKYDKCLSSLLFPNIGQSIASYSYGDIESAFSDDELIKDKIELWIDEYEYANMDIIKSFSNKPKKPYFGDFIMAINERNSDIGCAAVRFHQDFSEHFMFVCNFAVGNIEGQPIYTAGEIPGSDCTNRYGTSLDYEFLCHRKEIYNYGILPVKPKPRPKPKVSHFKYRTKP